MATFTIFGERDPESVLDRRSAKRYVRPVRNVRVLVLYLLLVAGMVAFFLVADLPAHDDRLITLSFIAGAIAARVLPPLVRWANRSWP